MKRIRRASCGVAGSAGALGLAVVLAAAANPRALADERPKSSKAVQVPVQGGGEAVAPVPGAPPVAEPSLAARPAAGGAPSPAGSAASASTSSRRLSIHALSFADGEATLEIDGVSTVVRAGSRIGNHVVKSLAPGRVVLARGPAEPGATDTTGWGAAPLVIVTFDAAGQGKPRVFWASDPEAPAPAPAEVKRP
jgi:hypothetical protein